MIELSLQVLTAVVIIVIAVRETVQLVRNPRDVPLRVLVVGLWCLAWAATTGITHPEVRATMRALLGVRASLLVNATVVVTGYCLATFFLLATQEVPEHRKRRVVRWELAGVLVALVICFGAWAVAPEGALAHQPVTTADWRQPHSLVWFMDIDLATVWFWSVGVWRGWRFLRSVTQRWARLAIGLVVAGAAFIDLGMWVLSFLIDLTHILFASAPAHFPHLAPIYLAALLVGQPLMVLGLALPSIAAAANKVGTWIDRAAQRRYQRRIGPLWRTLTAEFPFITLPAGSEPLVPNGGGTGPDTAVAQVVQQQSLDPDFTRLVSEVADGLALLAPYYIAGGLDPHAATNGLTDPGAAAEVVHGALRARVEERQRRGLGDELKSLPPYPRLIPDWQDWQKMSGWLAEVADSVSEQADRDPQLAR